jgi:hypothetical protein
MPTQDTIQPHSVHTLRLPRATAEQVRAIAARERERESVIFRRLIRRGLEAERKGEAA